MIEVKDEVRDWRMGGYRYVFVEADGGLPRGKFSWAGKVYAQRPAALRAARPLGYGVWDGREQELILDPDWAKRYDLVRNDYQALVEASAVALDLIAALEEYEPSDVAAAPSRG